MNIDPKNLDSWRNAVIYHIFIDRFAGLTHHRNRMKPKFCGGNLRGIIEKLPYIKDLGINAILLSPFYKGVAYHGYHITDFYKIDKRFGTERDLQELITKAHAAGIRVLIDFVPNHMSSKHPFFIEARTNRKSQYREWFFFKPNNDYMKFLTFKELAKINLDHPTAMEHIRGAAAKWLKFGVDGMRIDHVIGLSNQNLSDLTRPLRAEFPKAIFFGETVINRHHNLKEISTLRFPHKYWICLLRRFSIKANELIAKNYAGLLDGILDFVQEDDLFKYAKRRHSNEKIVQKQSSILGNQILQFSFLDNHDNERFLFKVKNNKQKLLRGVEALFDITQPKIIYYGTEIGMTQKCKFSKRRKYPDLLARQPMIWDEKKQDQELLARFKEIIAKNR